MIKISLAKIKKCIFNPYIIIALIIKGRFKFLSDQVYLRIMYKAAFGRRLRLNSPTTFNEKLQWLKLYYYNQNFSKFVDKYEVRKIVKDSIGEEYLIPLIGVWDDFDNIEWDKVPKEFVLKCTHDSGSVIICKDKTDFQFDNAKKKVKKWMSRNYYWISREKPYKYIKPRVIIEKLLKNDEKKQIRDYKFFCFNGEPKYMYISENRELGFRNITFDYYDMEFNKIKVEQSAHRNSNINHTKPDVFDDMVKIASKLSKGLPEVRIDLYELDGKIYFGEFTFFHHGGFVPFIPEQFDYELGDYIDLQLCGVNSIDRI